MIGGDAGIVEEGNDGGKGWGRGGGATSDTDTALVGDCVVVALSGDILFHNGQWQS